MGQVARPTSSTPPRKGQGLSHKGAVSLSKPLPALCACSPPLLAPTWASQRTRRLLAFHPSACQPQGCSPLPRAPLLDVISIMLFLWYQPRTALWPGPSNWQGDFKSAAFGNTRIYMYTPFLTPLLWCCITCAHKTLPRH